jgi:hypothetical protein
MNQKGPIRGLRSIGDCISKMTVALDRDIGNGIRSQPLWTRCGGPELPVVRDDEISVETVCQEGVGGMPQRLLGPAVARMVHGAHVRPVSALAAAEF